MAEWRVILGDRKGRPIANYSPIARDRAITPRLLRPWSLAFRVPSSHPDVCKPHTDGLPKLVELARTVRLFRREWIGTNVAGWVCRFAGIVWNVQDSGDESALWTAVTAFDPFQRLARVYTGVDSTARVGDGAQLAKALVDAANATDYTGIATSGYGNVFDVAPSQSVQFQRSAVGDGVIQLAGAYNGFDPIFAPVYQAPGTEDGTLVAMSCRTHYGSTQPGALLGYRMAPHNISRVDRTPNVDNMANAITGVASLLSGGDQITAFEKDDASIATYGRFEDNPSFSDVADFATLDAQTKAELASRSTPAQMLTLTIATSDSAPDGAKRGRVPMPWRDFDLGDSLPTYVDESFRGGFQGTQRVYGFTLTNDDANVERLTSLVTSPGA